MDIEISENISKEDEEFIYKGLLEYNLSRLEDKNTRELGVFMQDEDNRKVAGLIGSTHGNWLFVKYLFVNEDLRGKNIGSSILNKAEEEARNRGCKYCFLDTFSFQAPDFYRKHGYKEVFKLENYPVSGKRYYFTKNL